jgi:signal peptidase I
VGKIVARPVDKREHYVKRCVAIAGDKFSVINGEVHINGTKQEMPKKRERTLWAFLVLPLLSYNFRCV